MKKNRVIKSILIILNICMVLIAQGCNSYEAVDKYKLPEVKNQNEKILYRHWDTRFITYNTDTHSIEDCNEENQFFQFEFNNSKKFFTAGDSDEGMFKIVQLKKDTFIDILELKNKEDAIFPLAANDKTKNYFFVIYKGKTGKKREIVRLDEKGKLISYLKTTDAVMSGILVKNNLYYSVYNAKKDTCDIYSLNIKNVNDTPKLVRTGVEEDELYYHDGEIFYQDSKKIFSDTKSFENKSDNHFYEKYKILVQIDVDENADLALTITDTNTAKLIKKVANPIDFSIKNNIMTVYCDNNIENIDLSNRVE